MKFGLLALVLAIVLPAGAASFSGTLKSSTDNYMQDLGEPTTTLVPYLSAELAGKHKFSKRLRTQWKLSVLSNLEAKSAGATEELPLNEQTFADIPEAYVERKWGSNKLRLGMNTVNWGVVDGYSPSNVINTSAYFHPLRTPKRGSPMVELESGGESLSVHGLYIPRQPRAVLPAANSRWLPQDVLVNLSTALPAIRLPDRLDYTFGSEFELEGDGAKARDHNYGARLQSHVGSWDFQLTHFDGASPFPKIRPTLVINSVGNEFVADPAIRLDPVTYRVRNSGAGITYAGENWIYRLEGAYTHVESMGYKENSVGFGLYPWSWTAVAGVETNFDIGRNSLTVLAQYYHSEVPIPADNYISSSYRLFDRTGVFGLRYPMSDKLMLSGSAMIETKTHGLFWTAGFEQKLKDALKWGLSWRDFSAQEDGLLKTFDKNDHVTLDLAYFF